MNLTKPYLCFMAGPNEETNLKELVEPLIPYIRGVCALVHDVQHFDKGVEYLIKVNTKLGAGNILEGTYGRHDASRNRILYETGIQEGDWYCQTDTLERPKPEFFQYFQDYLVKDNPSIDAWYYYGKPFFVKFNETLRYQGNPHESLVGINRAIELSPYHPDDRVVRENVRPIKRANDKFHWVSHYLRYLLLPNSNQNLLGLEHHAQKYSFEYKENIRKGLINFLVKNKYPRTIDGVLEAMRFKSNEMRWFASNHKILNDFYRLKILGDETVVDSHSVEAWDNMTKF